MRLMMLIWGFLAVGCAAWAAEQAVVGPTGKSIGVIIDCNSCKDPGAGEACQTGVSSGYHAGKRCGQCLITANFGTKLLYPHDLYLTGTLQKPDGSPLADEFVRLFLPNTWTVRTRTSEKGSFRLVLGATQDREGGEVQVDLGTRVRPKVDSPPDYALYMLPENYKPCPDE